VNVTVIPLPDKPVIISANNQLISSSPSGNQWFSMDSAITGATNSIFRPASDGNYQVQVTLNGCVSAMSDSYHYVAADSTSAIRLYPNPVTDCFSIVFNFPNINSVTVVLYNTRGEKLMERKNLSNGSILCLTTYPPGSYILTLINESSNEVLGSQQIIKR
jgi:hypothetical protein